jgi:hypothetical protein
MRSITGASGLNKCFEERDQKVEDTINRHICMSKNAWPQLMSLCTTRLFSFSSARASSTRVLTDPNKSPSCRKPIRDREKSAIVQTDAVTWQMNSTRKIDAVFSRTNCSVGLAPATNAIAFARVGPKICASLDISVVCRVLLPVPLSTAALQHLYCAALQLLLPQQAVLTEDYPGTASGKQPCRQAGRLASWPLGWTPTAPISMLLLFHSGKVRFRHTQQKY